MISGDIRPIRSSALTIEALGLSHNGEHSLGLRICGRQRDDGNFKDFSLRQVHSDRADPKLQPVDRPSEQAARRQIPLSDLLANAHIHLDEYDSRLRCTEIILPSLLRDLARKCGLGGLNTASPTMLLLNT